MLVQVLVLIHTPLPPRLSVSEDMEVLNTGAHAPPSSVVSLESDDVLMFRNTPHFNHAICKC